jgi:hypothetical protein
MTQSVVGVAPVGPAVAFGRQHVGVLAGDREARLLFQGHAALADRSGFVLVEPAAHALRTGLGTVEVVVQILLVLGHCGILHEEEGFSSAPHSACLNSRVSGPQRAAARGADKQVVTAFAAAAVVITVHLLTGATVGTRVRADARSRSTRTLP